MSDQQPQFKRWQEFQKTPGAQRQEQLEELRLRVHQFVIEQLGPLLTDQRHSDSWCTNRCTRR
jgi:hypothetical protein